jgi:hypothetical protein
MLLTSAVRTALARPTQSPVPLLSIDAGHSGHIARTKYSHPSSRSRNFLGLA